MPEGADWSHTSYEGNRLRQHREFLALPLREKLKIVEEMCEVADHFAKLRARRGKSADAARQRNDAPPPAGH